MLSPLRGRRVTVAVREEAVSNKKNIKRDEEEETPERTDECKEWKMEGEKRWHSYWVSLQVGIGEGKRNSRLQQIERKWDGQKNEKGHNKEKEMLDRNNGD